MYTVTKVLLFTLYVNKIQHDKKKNTNQQQIILCSVILSSLKPLPTVIYPEYNFPQYFSVKFEYFIS